MAIYHANTKPIARRAGRSAVAAAAYRSGTELVDARTGLIHDYTRKGGVVWTEILTPDGSAVERNQLWNAAELAEKRKDARTAREWIVALPSELSAEQRTALARDFAQALVVRYGVAVDFAIHAPDREGDHRNHHAHLLTTTRQFSRAPAGGLMLGAKAHIELSDKARRERGLEGAAEEVKAVRVLWERTANAALEAAGVDARIDARSLQAQGIDREATQHLGPAASEMERRGKATDRGDGNRQVHVNNAERARLVAEIIDLKAERARIEAERQEAERLQAALQQLEQAAFDIGLSLRRGTIPETVLSDLGEKAIKQAEAAGLPDDFIKATIQRMGQKVQEIVGREEAAERARRKAERKAQRREAKRLQKAQQQLEQAVFDVGLVFYRGTIEETAYYDMRGKAIQQAEAAGLSGDVIDATIQRMGQKVVEVIEREEAAEQARMEAEREAEQQKAERLQAARQQLELTVFDVGLAVRRGHLPETEATVQIDDALRQAAAEGLPDAVIQAALERMHQQVQQRADQEQQAARIQQEQETVRQIRALTDDIRQVGGWQEDRHRPAFVAAGFVPTGEPNSYRHPLDAATNVAEAQATLFKTLDETRKARERAQRRSTTQQRWTARRERRMARYQETIERLIIEGPQGDFSNDDYEEELYDDALDFYWDADTRQWRHPYQAILQEDLDRLRQVLAEGRDLYEKEVYEHARRLHLQNILENMLASETVEDLQPIVDELASMGCHRDASGQWGHQQAGTEKGADLDRLIQLFNEVEQHYALRRVGQIIRLAADIHKSGWQEDRHQAALLAAGFVQDPKSGEYSHPLSYIPDVQAAVITLFEVIKNPGPQSTPSAPPPPPSPWRPRGPR
ncbi:MobQ family relaxase [Acidithiobacillus thiooxidans]|uniref:MobQ family relaxase n=1 Tax=Acidithiobacillus thiooxidans TaxID=930 RepID=UPI0002624E8E|nr:MobQ family relaxase [Acidithiobacillus thiooxidans]